jgi:hypothetical protein
MTEIGSVCDNFFNIAEALINRTLICAAAPIGGRAARSLETGLEKLMTRIVYKTLAGLALAVALPARVEIVYVRPLLSPTNGTVTRLEQWF